jgi:hypothetical protein
MAYLIGMSDIVKKAIEQSGGPTKLARHLGIKQPSIAGWKQIPAERVVGVEEASGIPREVLRPELYAGMDTRAVTPATMAQARKNELRPDVSIAPRPQEVGQ